MRENCLNSEFFESVFGLSTNQYKGLLYKQPIHVRKTDKKAQYMDSFNSTRQSLNGNSSSI